MGIFQKLLRKRNKMANPLQEDKNAIKEIIRRLTNLETHIINMVIPIQNLSKNIDPDFLDSMNRMTCTPIKIDDAGLKQVLGSFSDLMERFSKGSWAVDPEKVYAKLHELTAHTFSLVAQNNTFRNQIQRLEDEIAKQKIFVTVSGMQCQNNTTQSFSKLQEDFLDSEIWDEETSTRLANILRKEKLKKWRNVLEYTKVRCYKLERFGRKTIEELETIFKKYDIDF